MEKDILKFDLSPKQIRFKDILNKEFIELEIWAISTINPNRNNSHFTLESLQDALPHCKNKPIVGFFENNDFTTHEGKTDYDPELGKEFWNTERGERILGWIRESDPVEIVEQNGLHWLKFRCVLCTTYCYRQVRRLLKDKRKKVSVEITVKEHEFIDGIEEIKKFVLNGVTILGSKNGKAVLEGIPGAHLSILENLDEDVMAEQKRILTFAYNQLDGADGETNDEDKTVEDNSCLGEENTKKEVNQADMSNIEKENGNTETFGYSIKVDKSKEAMSDKPWGEVDKTELRHKVVEADNFKAVASDIFLDLREGWEDGEVSKLKYPVMELSGNTAVYNRDGLASAKAYAEQHDEKEVLDKIGKIYEDLDLEDSEEDKEKACKMAAEYCGDYCDIKFDSDDGENADNKIEDKDDDAKDDRDKDSDDSDDNSDANKEGYSDGDGEHGPDCDCPECQEKKLCNEPVVEHEEVVVAPLTPDVAVIVEEGEEINENKPTLTMEDIDVDLGIPQCEEGPSNAEIHDGEKVVVDAEAPDALMPEGGIGVTVANDEGSATINVVPGENGKDKADLKVDCHDFAKELEDLKIHCQALEQDIKDKDDIITGYVTKIETYADYEDIKSRLEDAEKKLFAYHCEELKTNAINLMSGENIKTEYYNDILNKCVNGKYGCEEDIKKDIAIAIYSSRPAQKQRYSVAIPVAEDVEIKKEKKNNTPASKLKGYLNKE